MSFHLAKRQIIEDFSLFTLSNCLKCRKNTESKTPKVVKTKNERIILLPIGAMCNSKKS